MCLPIPAGGKRSPPRAHVRALHLEIKDQSLPRSAVFPLEPARFPPECSYLTPSGGLLLSRGRGAWPGLPRARRGRALRPAERLHRARSPRLAAGCHRRSGRFHDGDGHGLFRGYNPQVTRSLLQMHTRLPESSFALLGLSQIYTYLNTHTSLDLYV